MERPLVSVIIACKNRPDEIRRVLADLRKQDYPRIEIVVVDDGSTPPLPDLGVDMQLRHASSRGASAARNTAIERSSGDFLVGFDDDVTMLSIDFLSRAVGLALANPNAAIIGFCQRRPDGSLHYLQPAQSDSLCKTAKFFGYGFLLRRTAIDRIGSFVPAITFGHEEIELSLRALDAGYDILFDPALELTHHESPIGRDWRRFRRLTLRNQFYGTILRHPWWFIGPSLVIQTGRFIAMTSKMEGVEWSAIWFAARETLRNSLFLWRERRPIRFATLRRNRALNRRPEVIGAHQRSSDPSPSIPTTGC